MSKRDELKDNNMSHRLVKVMFNKFSQCMDSTLKPQSILKYLL